MDNPDTNYWSTRRKMTPDDELLVRYLLGKTTAEEANRVFERKMSDPAYLDHAMMLEEELIEEYVAGLLRWTDRRALERQMQTSASLRQKVELASSIHRHLAAKSSSPARQPAWTMWALGLAACAAILFAVWLGHKGSMNTPVQHTQSTPSEPAANPEIKQSKTDIRKTSPESPSLLMVVTLTPLERSKLAITKEISLSGGAKWVRLRLVLEPADQFQFYRAHVGPEGNESKIVSGWTPARKAPEGRVVILQIAADRLSPGQYQVLLKGKAADGSIEDAEGYVFTVE